jgi:hypothetical protein
VVVEAAVEMEVGADERLEGRAEQGAVPRFP